MQSSTKFTGHPSSSASLRRDGAQRHRRFALAFGPAQVRGEDQLGRPCSISSSQRRQGFLDARVIGDDHLAVLLFERDVVIHAHEHAFAVHVQVSNREFCHKSILCEVGTPRCGVPAPFRRGTIAGSTCSCTCVCAAERDADSAARYPYPETGGRITDPRGESKRFRSGWLEENCELIRVFWRVAADVRRRTAFRFALNSASLRRQLRASLGPIRPVDPG